MGNKIERSNNMEWVEFRDKIINLDKVNYIEFHGNSITFELNDYTLSRVFENEVLEFIEALKNKLNITLEI